MKRAAPVSPYNAYRDGKIHVCDWPCDTCVFRSGNLMRLEPGRLAAMVAEAKADESAIICHSTLYYDNIDNAVCRGFYDRHPTQPLQIAERLGLVEFDRSRSFPLLTEIELVACRSPIAEPSASGS